MSRSIFAAALLASAPPAECARVSVELDSAGWNDIQLGKTCYDSRLSHTHHHTSLESAKAACEARPAECGGVYNLHGKGQAFYLCKRGVAFGDSKTKSSWVQELVLADEDLSKDVVVADGGLSKDSQPQQLSPSRDLKESDVHEQDKSRAKASSGGGEAVLDEWRDEAMGVALSMIDKEHWQTTKWGIVQAPVAYAKWAQSYVSIMTHKTPMKVYRGRSYGIVFHITPQYDFWKYFQVIGKGDGEGNIVGGPGDGGSHTPGGESFRRSPTSMSKDYEWFASQKSGILAKYNTVYGNADYNEFIVNALPSQAIAGVVHYLPGRTAAPDDREMCNFLCWRAGIGAWPIFKYSPGKLEVERYLECVPDDSPAEEEYGCNKDK